MRVSFMPLRVLANFMRVYFLPVRVLANQSYEGVFSANMKVFFHTVRVLADMMRVLAIYNHTSSFL